MTREQERARARRRQEKLDAKAAQRQREAARNRQAAVIVLAVLVVVLGFVVLSSKLSTTTSPKALATAGASSPATTEPPPSVPGCTAPPARPTSIKTQALPDQKSAAGKTFTAVITTNCGAITVRLDGAKAPQTVASFTALARSSYFASSPCHRLTTASIWVLQCGDPLGGTGTGPGYSYGLENVPKDGKYPKGTLAMARRATDTHSNADQFFIVYQDTVLPTTGGGYSIFGTVTGGMDIVEKIAAAGVSGGASDGAPAAPISILKVAVTEKKA